MEWYRKVMAGRYGGDRLSVFLLIISIFLTLLYQFTELSILITLGYIPLFMVIYRMVSKDIQKRSMENYKFAILVSPLYAKTKNIQERIKASRSYKYFKCANCKTTLRVPRGKGKILATCPKCKTKVMKKT